MYNLPHVPSGSQPFYPPLPAQFLNQLSSQTHLNQLAFNAMSGSAIPTGTSLPNIPDFPVGIVGDGAGVPGAGALPVLNVNGLPVLGGVDGLPVSGPMPQGPLPPLDLNSPEIFRQSIELAKEQVARVEMLTRNVISGIERAYEPGIRPSQTALDYAELQVALHTLSDFLRQSGVGALPIVTSADAIMTPSVEEATKGAQADYERKQRIHDNAAIVAGLLALNSNN
ncbi:hypothetical protein SISNIDRAFT_490474 [Sistotremastrum niveocremeum HHB9708]|uniref:Uncharacterized protein n=1 Tax=Sistotremastrum niveocremeum HHB9708 TaxID=1314777 RepID=A0A164NX71_9AGAM|nr:hypothetical protein SISNIDRAFT_490474 [Sistotremastrum niveocremeum HHB9708]